MRNVWEIYLELNNLEEEIDNMLTKKLELKHKLERIDIDV